MTDPESSSAGATPGKGRLVLVGTPIGNLGDLSPRAVAVLRDADVIAAEDTRSARAMLTHLDIRAAGRLVAIHDHNEHAAAPGIVAQVLSGLTVAYISDAGMPGVSDPGERLVRAVLDADGGVEVVPGPSAVLTALVASGLPAGRFVFEGFLPRKGRARTERLRALATEPRTVVLFESPRRVRATLVDLAEVCSDDRPAVLARELTKLHEEIVRGTLAELATRYEDADPRGECVIVVEGAPAAAPATDDDVRHALHELLDAGVSVRDAAARVSADLGVAKRLAYEIAVGLTA